MCAYLPSQGYNVDCLIVVYIVMFYLYEGENGWIFILIFLFIQEWDNEWI